MYWLDLNGLSFETRQVTKRDLRMINKLKRKYNIPASKGSFVGHYFKNIRTGTIGIGIRDYNTPNKRYRVIEVKLLNGRTKEIRMSNIGVDRNIDWFWLVGD